MENVESFVSARHNNLLRRASRDYERTQEAVREEDEGAAAAEFSRSIPARATSIRGESTNLNGDRNDPPMKEGTSDDDSLRKRLGGGKGGKYGDESAHPWV